MAINRGVRKKTRGLRSVALQENIEDPMGGRSNQQRSYGTNGENLEIMNIVKKRKLKHLDMIWETKVNKYRFCSLFSKGKSMEEGEYHDLKINFFKAALNKAFIPRMIANIWLCRYTIKKNAVGGRRLHYQEMLYLVILSRLLQGL